MTRVDNTHKQAWVKVNAPVDRGIAELIEALSAFPKLQTFASCQGGYPRSDADKEGMPAVVFFHYGQDDHADPYQGIADFVLGYLGPALMKELGDLVSIHIEVTTQYIIMGELKVRQGAMPRTIKTLKRLRREFED
jgi:hypothetical protein